MKKNRSLLVIVVCFLWVGCQKEPQQNQTTLSRTLTSEYSKEALDSLAKSPLPNRQSGAFIQVGEAHDALVVHKDYRNKVALAMNQTFDPKNDIYGFGFGLDKLKILFDKIEKWNKDSSVSPGDKIAGVRVYLSHKEFKVGSKTDTLPDVFLIPYKVDGAKNIFKIDDDFDKENVLAIDSFILNTSAPCPNRCN